MRELYEIILKKAKEQVEKEKETKLSEDTYRLISLVQSLHNQLIASYPDLNLSCSSQDIADVVCEQ